jgi:hypothetical protein
MRAQKMREETVEKERDEHFNTIQPMIPLKQERRVKEMSNISHKISIRNNIKLKYFILVQKET